MCDLLCLFLLCSVREGSLVLSACKTWAPQLKMLQHHSLNWVLCVLPAVFSLLCSVREGGLVLLA